MTSYTLVPDEPDTVSANTILLPPPTAKEQPHPMMWFDRIVGLAIILGGIAYICIIGHLMFFKWWDENADVVFRVGITFFPGLVIMAFGIAIAGGGIVEEDKYSGMYTPGGGEK